MPNTSDNEYVGDVIAGALSPPLDDARRRRRDRRRRRRYGRGRRRRRAAADAAAAGDRPRRPRTAGSNGARGLRFTAVAPNTDDKVTVPEGYEQNVVIRWGDPILRGAPAFDPDKQTAAAQAGQFGYNNDFLAPAPAPRRARPPGSSSPTTSTPTRS